METRARYVILGLFLLAVIAGGFAFVYWINQGGVLAERSAYRIRFDSPVLGLRPGSAVLFNGIRVGEVTDLRLDASNPKQVTALIAVDRGTPIRADTQVALETQGLLGAPSLVLKGGDPAAPPVKAAPDGPPLLTASPASTQDAIQAARAVLGRIDQILGENAQPLHNTIVNFSTFSDALARNSKSLDTIVEGLSRMLGSSAKPAPVVYDLTPARTFPAIDKLPTAQLAVADPTAVLAFDTQKILVRAPDGQIPDLGAQWSDNVTKLFQAKVIQSFENAGYGRVARAADAFTADYQLQIDVRNFQVTTGPEQTANVEFGAKIMGDGHIIDSRVFRASEPVKTIDAPHVVAALNKAFDEAVTQLVMWTLQGIESDAAKAPKEDAGDEKDSGDAGKRN
jgi:phospholipid/cholesterol/gamma-HCH transport system substrate-binding protein